MTETEIELRPIQPDTSARRRDDSIVDIEAPISYEEAIRTSPSPERNSPEYTQTDTPTSGQSNQIDSPPEYTNEEHPPAYESVVTRLKKPKYWISIVVFIGVLISFFIQFGLGFFRTPKLNYVKSESELFAGDIQGRKGYRDGKDSMFYEPFDVVVRQESVYVSDSGNHSIRVIRNDTTFTLAGSPTSGYRDGNGSEAQFNEPFGIALDSNDNVLVADHLNCAVRNITKNGFVSTLYGFQPCTSSSRVLSIAVHKNDTVFVSTEGKVIYMLQKMGDGIVTTPVVVDNVAGPSNKLLIRNELLYYARLNGQIRTIDLVSGEDGSLNRVNGESSFSYGDGNIAKTLLCNPFGIAVSPTNRDSIYVSSTCAHMIKYLNASESFTVSGTFDRGLVFGSAESSRFGVPMGLDFLDPKTLVVAEFGNHLLRRVKLLL